MKYYIVNPRTVQVEELEGEPSANIANRITMKDRYDVLGSSKGYLGGRLRKSRQESIELYRASQLSTINILRDRIMEAEIDLQKSKLIS